jgi:CTP synthase
VKGTKACDVYGSETIYERHRHRYEVNNNYRDQLGQAGLVFSGLSSDKSLVEMIEIPDHPWFVAGQFHPEFNSNPRDGHPLFEAFVAASVEHSKPEAS